MTVRAILDSKGHNVATIDPDVTLKSAIETLARRRIGALLVTDGHAIAGIVSERDVVRVIAEHGATALDKPVREFMTRDVMTCSHKETVAVIMERMTEGKFRHLPVVESGRIDGIISIGDVVKYRVMEYEREQEALRDYIKTA